jgi:PPM family protein phosphatase
MNAGETWIERISTWLDRGAPDFATAQLDDLNIAFGSGVNGRAENQDRVAVVRYRANTAADSFMLFVLCDGVGGLREGGRCASLAVAAMIMSIVENSLPSPLRLRKAVAKANSTVLRSFHEKGGTTLAAVFLPAHGTAIGVNVGDSRVYQRALPHQLAQLSVDDNIKTQMSLLPHVSGPAAAPEMGRHLTQFIGIDGEIAPHSFFDLKLPGFGFVLATDGLSAIDTAMMARIATNSASAGNAVKRLLTLSRWLGVKDNASALVTALSTQDIQMNLTAARASGVCEIWDVGGKLEFFPEMLRPFSGKRRARSSGRPGAKQPGTPKGDGGDAGTNAPTHSSARHPPVEDAPDLHGTQSDRDEGRQRSAAQDSGTKKHTAPRESGSHKQKPDVTFELTDEQDEHDRA